MPNNQQTAIKKIAFIGLGNMGKPMAENLIKNGFALNVFDLNTAVLDDLAKRGDFTCGRKQRGGYGHYHVTCRSTCQRGVSG